MDGLAPKRLMEIDNILAQGWNGLPQEWYKGLITMRAAEIERLTKELAGALSMQKREHAHCDSIAAERDRLRAALEKVVTVAKPNTSEVKNLWYFTISRETFCELAEALNPVTPPRQGEEQRD